MLSRTLRRSRPGPSLGALSGLQHGQMAYIHSIPSVAPTKSALHGPVGSPLAKRWREKTVVELKAELKRRGLPTTGRKEELVTRLTNANLNFGTTEAFVAIMAEKSMPSLKTSTPSTFSRPVKAPPVPKAADLYVPPIVAPTPKLNTQSLTSSTSNLRIGSAIASSPVTPTLLNKGSFTNLRAASTLTPSKSSSPNISPKTSQSNLRSSELKSPSKSRQLHTSKPIDGMLSDNVHLPSFTAEVPIEIPRVPILPTTQRAPPRIEIETPPMEHLIITTAGAHTHAAPPGGGSEHVREHLQSDSTRPRVAIGESEQQDGKFEGDWHSENEEDSFKFVPEKGEIPVQDRGALWGIVGAAILWGVFGSGKKNEKK